MMEHRWRTYGAIFVLLLIPFLGCIGQEPADPGAVTVTVTELVEKTTISEPDPVVVTTTKTGVPAPPETITEYREIPVLTTVYEEQVITTTEQGLPVRITTTVQVVKTSISTQRITTTETVTITRTNIPGYFPYSLTGQGGAVDTLLVVGVLGMLGLLWMRRRNIK